jgi:hypothetical protein
MTSKQTRSRARETPVDCAIMGHCWKALFAPGQFLCMMCGRLASCPKCSASLPPGARVRYCRVHRANGGEV